MNFITHPDIEFSPLVNEPFVLACRKDHPLASKKLVEWRARLAEINWRKAIERQSATD
jgi:DNA-binding transcriptional LysR family regulator